MLEGVPSRHPTNYSRAGKVWLVGTGMAQIELQFVSGLQTPTGLLFASTAGMGLTD
jgi:hypothetical protein